MNLIAGFLSASKHSSILDIRHLMSGSVELTE